MIRLESALGRQMLRFAQKARGPLTPYHSPDEDSLIAFPAHFVALTITAANVVKATVADYSHTEETLIAGVTLTAGQVIYKDASDSDKAKLCDANLTLAAATAYGITLHAALAGQPVRVIRGGPLSLGAILTKGSIYVAGATAAGDINPSADLASGWYTNILGFAYSTSILVLDIKATGITTT